MSIQQSHPPSRILAALLLLLAATSLPCGPLPARADPVPEITVVGNNAPPYRIIEGEDFDGIYFEAMKEIARRARLRLKFVEAPFKRALAMMEQGKADVMLGPNRTPEREKYMLYTGAAFPPADKAFYVYPGTPTVKRYEDLAGMRIAVQRGMRSFPRFDDDDSLTKVECFDVVQAVEKVLTGECDVLILPEALADYTLLMLGIDLTKSEYVAEGNPSYITLSKEGRALGYQQAIERAMAAMRADGTMQAILDRFR